MSLQRSEGGKRGRGTLWCTSVRERVGSLECVVCLHANATTICWHEWWKLRYPLQRKRMLAGIMRVSFLLLHCLSVLVGFLELKWADNKLWEIGRDTFSTKIDMFYLIDWCRNKRDRLPISANRWIESALWNAGRVHSGGWMNVMQHTETEIISEISLKVQLLIAF